MFILRDNSMKFKKYILLCVFCLRAGCCMADELPVTSPSPKIPFVPFLFQSNKNRLVFEHNSFDFGVIQRGIKLEHHFVIKNGSKNTIKIENVALSCDCMSLTNIAKGDILSSGQELKILVTLESQLLLDNFAEYIFIETDEKILSSYIFTLKGRSELASHQNAANN